MFGDLPSGHAEYRRDRGRLFRELPHVGRLFGARGRDRVRGEDDRGVGCQGISCRGEAALEETLKSARELVAKYGDTAKAIAHDTAKLKDKATDTLFEQSESLQITTFAAIIGIGFIACWICRRN